MNPLYYFKHELNGVPQFLSYAFDARYSCLRTRLTKFLEGIFSDEMLRKIGLAATVLIITPYWPDTNKVIWKTTEKKDEFISEVICMKILSKSKFIGFNIKEKWTLDIKNKCVSNIEEL